MRPTTEILEEQLAHALLESCCRKCGVLKRKTPCCAGKKSASAAPQAEPAPSATPVEEARSTTPGFIKRCVAAMTSGKGRSVDPKSKDGMSRAFAICTSTAQKHPEAAAAKSKVPEKRLNQYEKALAAARRARKT